MRKLVVTTESGEYITTIDVEEQTLVAGVVNGLRLFPTAAFYLDGRLVDGEVIRTIRAALAAGIDPTAPEPEATTPTSLPDAEKVQDYNETMQRVFADVRKHHAAMLQDMADHTRMVGRVFIEREREFADEAARQRELTRKSLADVDLLGRSIKATQFQNSLVTATAHTEARARRRGGGMSWGDLVAGVRRVFTGER